MRDGENFSEITDARTFTFEAKNVSSQEDVTIATGWSKGIVSQQSYYKDAVFIHWPIILAFLIILGAIIFAITYWYRTEKWKKGRGTIIPQYEPPQKLPPAMAEVLCKESISKKTWPATLIDLAVRGYVTIEEDKPSMILDKVIKITLIIVGIIGSYMVYKIDESSWFFPLFILVVPFMFIIKLNKPKKDYIVKRKKENDEKLKGYEKDYLNTLLGLDNMFPFSTRKLKKSPTEGRALYIKMKSLEKSLYEEVDVDTNAYEKKISKEKIFGNFSGVGLINSIRFTILILALIVYSSGFISNLIGGKFLILVISVLLSSLIVLWFLRFEARLSEEGAIMREDWLGFKLYLETAEKYRMQNLTPEIFEKYLPYAMIFGIEKKWAKAFESLNMNPPSWYGVYGGYHSGSAGITSFSGNGGFSASAFSSSLSSSFSSAMGSSGASGGSGGSGGGGGAGGGGGGGGGGAS